MARQRFAKGLAAFLSFLTPEDKVLDLDYGQGNYSRQFVEHGLNVISFDSTGVPLPSGESRLEIIHGSPFEAPLPYRTFRGIWARDIFIHLDSVQLTERLGQCADWLAVGGVLYFCLLEGEGEKIIHESLPTGVRTRKIVYYRAAYLDDLLQSLDCPAVLAWYEEQSDRRWMHIIAQRKR